MDNAIYTEQRKGYTIAIHRDEGDSSPSDWADTNLFLVANHRCFYVVPPKGSTFESVAADHRKTHHIFGLEAYIHSDVSLSLAGEGKFTDRDFDVSQIGAVFVSKQEFGGKAEARKVAEGLVSTWNEYLSGDVYGYVVTKANACKTCGHDEPEQVGSCWGFYGSYEDGALAEARSFVDAEAKGAKKPKKSK